MGETFPQKWVLLAILSSYSFWCCALICPKLLVQYLAYSSPKQPFPPLCWFLRLLQKYGEKRGRERVQSASGKMGSPLEMGVNPLARPKTEEENDGERPDMWQPSGERKGRGMEKISCEKSGPIFVSVVFPLARFSSGWAWLPWAKRVLVSLFLHACLIFLIDWMSSAPRKPRLVWILKNSENCVPHFTSIETISIQRDKSWKKFFFLLEYPFQKAMQWYKWWCLEHIGARR